MSYHVRSIIKSSGCALKADVEHFCEVGRGLFLVEIYMELVVDPADIFLPLQLGQAARDRERAQGNEHAGMASQNIIYFAAEMNECVVFAFQEHDALHAVGEDEGCSFTLHAVLALEVAKNVPKIDVEELGGFGDHEIVVVAIAEAKDVAGDAVCGGGDHEAPGATLERKGMR